MALGWGTRQAWRLVLAGRRPAPLGAARAAALAREHAEAPARRPGPGGSGGYDLGLRPAVAGASFVAGSPVTSSASTTILNCVVSP